MCKINGKKLGELRTKAGVSQKELAKEEGNIYTLHNGKTILFKREQFEKYLENKSYI